MSQPSGTGRPDRRRKRPRPNAESARQRNTRVKKERGEAVSGQRFVVEIGNAAQGGQWVARLPQDAGDLAGRVVFVRHALTGERVVVEITEGRTEDRFFRGDAIDVLDASSQRVAPPCELARPGGCGGCDLQHVSLQAQRSLKATLIEEQLRRVAHLDQTQLDRLGAIEVEPIVAGGSPELAEGLAWRSRMRYHRLPNAALGLRAHRSHTIVEVDHCPVASPEATVSVEGEPSRGTCTEQVGAVEFVREIDGFWQAHVGAPQALVAAVGEAAAYQPGERVLDLYAGVGLFSAFAAEAVGPLGWVSAVEGDARAAEHAADNVVGWANCEAISGDVAAYLRAVQHFDVVVLDPPRTGAGRAVVEGIVAAAPRRVVYVSCDPATFARDVAWFAELGYDLESLRAFDAFPMTHHVECVALLTKIGSDLR